MPPPGMVQLTPSRGSAVTLILNAEPDQQLGVGGFEASERALRRSARWFKSIPDDTISFDGTLDIDAHAGPAIETRLRRLQLMGLAGDHDAPPTIRVTGDIWDRGKTWDWVVAPNGIKLGARLWNPDGSLRRQQVTVDLERFTGLDEIEAIKVKSTRRGAGHRRRRRTISTRKGDTIRAIALRELGSATRWRDVVTWNRKRLKSIDPDARLRTGTHLLIR